MHKSRTLGHMDMCLTHVDICRTRHVAFRLLDEKSKASDTVRTRLNIFYGFFSLLFFFIKL